jgi:ribonuclease VapC
MFVDASIIVAILGRESDSEELRKSLASYGNTLLISPMVKYEATVSLARAKTGLTTKPSPSFLRQVKETVDLFIVELGAEEISISPEIGNGAIEAIILYGKSVGHPAGLNLGDCFAYACAKACQVGIFYKGNDFAATDLA